MDLSVHCERVAAEETESIKGAKVSNNHGPPGHNSTCATSEDAVCSLSECLQDRLIIKSNVNGLVNGTSNGRENHVCSTLVISNSVENPKHPSIVQKNNDMEKSNNPETEISRTDKEEIVIEYVGYESERQMPDIMRLIQKDLSEPYSIYTYRYFIHNWPKLCFLAMHKDVCIGAIVCKLDFHRKIAKRGYIAMLAVDEKYRKQKIGSKLVRLAIQGMVNDKADEVVLETEITNQPALKLYENLGFVRDKRLFRYYLNGVDALRLKLWLR